MDRWKSRGGKKSERRREAVRRSERRKSEKEEEAGAPKGREVAIHCVLRMICGSGEPKSRLAKAAGAEPSGQMRDEKLYAVVARSTFPSQNAKSTSMSDRFWKLTCRKSARRCGAKHISKSKVKKQLTVSDHFWTFRCRFVWQVYQRRVRGIFGEPPGGKLWGPDGPGHPGGKPSTPWEMVSFWQNHGTIFGFLGLRFDP